MNLPLSPAHLDLLRRLDALPIPRYERDQAKAQAGLALGLVDALFAAASEVRGGLASFRSAALRFRRAH